jgi:hypothetical protein
LLILQRALQVFSVTLCLVLCCVWSFFRIKKISASRNVEIGVTNAVLTGILALSARLSRRYFSSLTLLSVLWLNLIVAHRSCFQPNNHFMQLRVKNLFAMSKCCTECGIPIHAINKVRHPSISSINVQLFAQFELHPPDTFGRACTMPRFFLEVYNFFLCHVNVCSCQ